MLLLKQRRGGAEAEGGASAPRASLTTSFSGFLSLGQQRRSKAPVPGPLSHPVSQETAVSPSPQAHAEVSRETDTESPGRSTWTLSGWGQRRDGQPSLARVQSPRCGAPGLPAGSSEAREQRPFSGEAEDPAWGCPGETLP